MRSENTRVLITAITRSANSRLHAGSGYTVMNAPSALTSLHSVGFAAAFSLLAVYLMPPFPGREEI